MHEKKKFEEYLYNFFLSFYVSDHHRKELVNNKIVGQVHGDASLWKEVLYARYNCQPRDRQFVLRIPWLWIAVVSIIIIYYNMIPNMDSSLFSRAVVAALGSVIVILQVLLAAFIRKHYLFDGFKNKIIAVIPLLYALVVISVYIWGYVNKIKGWHISDPVNLIGICSLTLYIVLLLFGTFFMKGWAIDLAAALGCIAVISTLTVDSFKYIESTDDIIIYAVSIAVIMAVYCISTIIIGLQKSKNLH